MNGAKPLFEAGCLSWRTQYLKPAKRLLVDLAVTETGLDLALVFANEFFLGLEARGHRVAFAPSSEQFHREKVDERGNPGKDPALVPGITPSTRASRPTRIASPRCQ